MAKIPTLGSDATTLSVSLDKAWARALVAAAGVPVPAQAVLRSAQEAPRGRRSRRLSRSS